MEFSENRVKTLLILFDQQHIKYHNNSFFKSIVNKLKKKKTLTKKQYDQLIYLLTHGKSMYEDNMLTTKN